MFNLKNLGEGTINPQIVVFFTKSEFYKIFSYLRLLPGRSHYIFLILLICKVTVKMSLEIDSDENQTAEASERADSSFIGNRKHSPDRSTCI